MKNQKIKDKIVFISDDILTIETYTDTLLYILQKDRDILKKLNSDMDFDELIWGLKTFYEIFDDIQEELLDIECYIRELEYETENGVEYFE